MSLSWYWSRFRAMGAREIAARLQKKLHARQDAPGVDFSKRPVPRPGDFPRLPTAAGAPDGMKRALQAELQEILGGRWIAFQNLKIQVDTPPRWFKDYLAGQEFPADQPGFTLNHRSLPSGGDIKLIWELSRWTQLTRLAQAAYLLQDQKAGEACLRWLDNWRLQNRPFFGWNWISALESGLRLIQFVWIDALLSASGHESQMPELRHEILWPHAYYTWRYRSFGSSANNHLLGELAGLIFCLARYPALEEVICSLEELQQLFEAEILAQFAEDGGNREQALNYHLFSWEFCWHARAALLAANRRFSPQVEDRLAQAAGFFASVQIPTDPWDYGDSDSAFVTLFSESQKQVVADWWRWLQRQPSPALEFWWGNSPFSPPGAPVQSAVVAKPTPGPAPNLDLWPASGIAMLRSDPWTLRWDLSPLGYLSTAAHGHLDALHLSIWLHGLAFVIDPGTGAYYADPKVRNYLASWDAHNGPCPQGCDFPERAGPFLWRQHHSQPSFAPGPDSGKQQMSGPWSATLDLPRVRLQRSIHWLPERSGWEIRDQVSGNDAMPRDFRVLWQFAPECVLTPAGSHSFKVSRQSFALLVELSQDWTQIEPIQPSQVSLSKPGPGLCSRAFRQIEKGPALLLRSSAARREQLPGQKACLLTTRFLALPR